MHNNGCLMYAVRFVDKNFPSKQKVVKNRGHDTRKQ